jgi:hypothetical protein
MGARVYTKTEDGYYYDQEGVWYHRSGEEGQYTYEQVASIFEANNDHVSSPTVDAMVSKAIDYVTTDIPPRSPTPPELQLLYDCGTPPHKGQEGDCTKHLSILLHFATVLMKFSGVL